MYLEKTCVCFLNLSFFKISLSFSLRLFYISVKLYTARYINVNNAIGKDIDCLYHAETQRCKRISCYYVKNITFCKLTVVLVYFSSSSSSIKIPFPV